MQPYDIINGTFEMVGAVFAFSNVLRLLKDKIVTGINPWGTAFFTAWGYWNILFYNSLNQPFSFYAGLSLSLCNTAWVIIMIKYFFRKNRCNLL